MLFVLFLFREKYQQQQKIEGESNCYQNRRKKIILPKKYLNVTKENETTNNNRIQITKKDL